MSEDSNKQCLQCGKKIPIYKYFCSIDCEVKHTEELNKKKN